MKLIDLIPLKEKTKAEMYHIYMFDVNYILPGTLNSQRFFNSKSGHFICNVIDASLAVSGLSFDNLMTKTRKENVFNTRSMAMWLLEDNGIDRATMRDLFNFKDVSTVRNAILSMQNYLDTDNKMRQLHNDIVNKLNDTVI